jgi:hypothetical protein
VNLRTPYPLSWLVACLIVNHAQAMAITNHPQPASPEARQTWLPAADRASQTPPTAQTQYILFNRAPGQGMYQDSPGSLGRQQFEEVLARFPNRPNAPIQTGLSYIFSPFRTPPETTVKALKTFLDAATQTATPVLIQIDLEHWWDARPDLWNWWDPSKAGYDPANRHNVEWSDWSPLARTLGNPRCRYVCIFNWESIRASESVLRSITGLLEASRP